MMKKYSRYLIIFIAIIILLQLPAAASGFSDTVKGAWYETYVDRLVQLNIINGYPDGSFRPNDTLSRGAFIKMLASYEGLYTLDTPPCSHWAAESWCILDDYGVFQGLNLPCTAASLDQGITRYEMAVIISNFMVNVFWEARVSAERPQTVIADYSSIPAQYTDAVVQAYGKGILTGFEDGSFQGGQSLTRAQGAAAIVRAFWSSERKPASFVSEGGVITEFQDENYTPFALMVREKNLVNAYGTPNTELRQMLFGNGNKTYFTSSSDAAAYMETVTVNVWKINSAGQKYASTADITVHKLVAEDVRRIFQEIFEDPEQFPIQSVGGARFTDTLRHSWGCAIDINPTQNCYCYYSNGVLVPITGSFWSPGYDPYSISPTGSVVRIFEKYGWGWGGQGYSSGKHDYMHFSIMKSGG